MADIAELAARLSIDLSQFTQGMNQAERITQQVVNQLNNLDRETRRINDTLRQNQAAATDLTQTDAQLEQAIRDLSASLNQANNATRDLSPQLNDLANESNNANKSAYDLGLSIGTKLKAAALVGGVAIGAIGTALATVGVGFIQFNKEAQEASEILNTAQRLNVNTDDLQAAQYAVERIGIPADTLNEGLQDILDKMGDLSANDGGEMKDFFERMGLDVKNFIGMDPLSILKTLNKEAQSLSASERTQLFESMGNDLSKLEPLLAVSAQRFSELEQQAHAFGLVTSNANLNAYDEYNQTLQDMQDKLSGMRDMVFNNLAEPMKEAITYVNEWVEAMGGGEQVSMAVSEAIVNGLLMAVEAGGWLAKRFTEVAGIAEIIASGLALVARGALEVAEIMSHMPAMKIMDKVFDIDATKSIQAMQAQLDGVLGQARDYRTIMEDVANKNSKIDQFSEGLTSRIGKGKEAMGASFAAQQDTIKLPNEIKQLTEALKSAENEYKKLVDADNKTTEQVTAANKAVQEAAKALATAQEQLKTAKVTATGARQYGQDDGGISRALYESKKNDEEALAYGTELDKKNKALLKEQQDQLKWKQKLDMDVAKQTDEAAKIQQEASGKMQAAVKSFGESVQDDKKGTKSPLSLEGAQMGFFTGGGYSDAELGRQPHQPAVKPYETPKFAGPPDNAKMQNLGVLHIASPDGKKMAEVMATPENARIIMQIAKAAINEYALDGQAAQS